MNGDTTTHRHMRVFGLLEHDVVSKCFPDSSSHLNMMRSDAITTVLLLLPSSIVLIGGDVCWREMHDDDGGVSGAVLLQVLQLVVAQQRIEEAQLGAVDHCVTKRITVIDCLKSPGTLTQECEKQYGAHTSRVREPLA